MKLLFYSPDSLHGRDYTMLDSLHNVNVNNHKAVCTLVSEPGAAEIILLTVQFARRGPRGNSTSCLAVVVYLYSYLYSLNVTIVVVAS